MDTAQFVVACFMAVVIGAGAGYFLSILFEWIEELFTRKK